MKQLTLIKKSFISIALCFVLLLGHSLPAKADTGSNFSASIKIGTAGYGLVDGARNDKFYHLTPGKASIYVSSCSGSFTISLRKGYFSASASVVDTVTVNKAGWYTFDNLSSDSKYYSLYIVANGKSGSSARISGTVHNHRA